MAKKYFAKKYFAKTIFAPENFFPKKFLQKKIAKNIFFPKKHFLEHLSLQHLSISAISQHQNLLIWFRTDFKSRFLGPFLTDVSCHGGICPGNIWPYQEYLSSYGPNFLKPLGSKFSLNRKFFHPNFSWPTIFSLNPFVWTQKFCGPKQKQYNFNGFWHNWN